MLSLKARRHAILEIIEARGIYGEAMRAKQALIGASDAQIELELLELRVQSSPAQRGLRDL